MKSVIEVPECLHHLEIDGAPIELPGSACIGKVLLLPSGIKPDVGIRYKLHTGYYYRITLSCVCLLEPSIQIVSVSDQNKIYGNRNYGNKEKVEAVSLEVPVPELLYVTDLNYLHTGELCGGYSESPRGYLFRYDTQKSLVESYATAEQYFFPHIYHDAHLCLMAEGRSPRQILSYFWSSNFHSDWWGLFDQHRTDAFTGKGGNLVVADGPQNYLKYQNEAKAPKLDKLHRTFLSSYTNHLHIQARPLGIFTSFELADKTDATIKHSSTTYGDMGVLVGFAFHANDGHCWVYTKDKRLIRLRPEQVKVV